MQDKRYRFTTTLIVVLLCVMHALPAIADEPRPNIILILMDDIQHRNDEF
jgi:hypothetical protein